MELRHLRYFVAVGEALNFTKAAARLRVAQPALSRQVQDLEDEIGVDLLRRSPRGVTLTAEGKLFLQEVRELLKRVDESVEKTRALARGEYGELHIGYAYVPTAEILPAALEAFREAVPLIRPWMKPSATGRQNPGGIWSIGLRLSPSSPFLHSGRSLLAHQQRVWSASAADVFRLVANDRRNPRFEIFGALDCSLQRLCWVERELCTIAPRTASLLRRNHSTREPERYRAVAEQRAAAGALSPRTLRV
jgi:hypothetical protein